MCVLGLVRSGQRDETKEIGGRAGVRLVVSITPAVLSPVSRFLLVPLKRIDYVQKKFDNLNKKLSIQKEKALKPIKKPKWNFTLNLPKNYTILIN